MLTNPLGLPHRNAAIRRFFESGLWTVISVVFIVGNFAFGLVLCALLHVLAYVVIHFMFASLRRVERDMARESAQKPAPLAD